MNAPARRVRVVSPHSGPAVARRRIASDIDEQTLVGDVYVRALVRTQARLALSALACVGVVLAGLPLLLATDQALAQAQLLGFGVPWVLMGAGIPVLLVGVGWWYVRAVERAERVFADLVERS